MIKKDTFTFMYVLFRIEISTDSLTNKRGHKLHCHYWKVGRSSYHLARNVLYSKLLLSVSQSQMPGFLKSWVFRTFRSLQ